MKKIIFATCAALALATVLISCRKETGSVPLPPVAILPATPVQASVSGIVTDENNAPMPNASVLVGGTTYTTDSKGFFNTAQLMLDKHISMVQVTVPGYFKAIRSFPANPSRNYVSIKLIPKTLAGSFSSIAAGSISLPNGSAINFRPGSIVNKATGASYSGTVRVYSAYIDPTASDIGSRVPGNFMGQDNANMYALVSAGMIAVELESDGGVPLQLANGQTAAVKLLIPASIQASSLATIDTWSLDDRGVWKKEGSATKNGNFYEWQASHFSYWNCDIPNSSIYLNLLVTDQQAQPMPNVYVQIRPMDGNNRICHGHTDSSGRATALVPTNMAFTLLVYANAVCGSTPIHTQNIGSFTTNSNLTINTNPSPATQVTVSGNALNCSGAPIQAGTAIIYAGSYNIYHVNIVNGSFSKTIYNCNSLSSVSVLVVDNASLQQSNTATVAVSGNTVNAGTLYACSNITTSDEFMEYTVDGTNYRLISLLSSDKFYGVVALNPPVIAYMEGRREITPVGTQFKLYFQGVNALSAGTYQVNQARYALVVNNDYRAAAAEPSARVTYTSFGPVGQYLEGSFNIPFTDLSTGTMVHSCTGTFRIRRY